jgi:hypothetical protein
MNESTKALKIHRLIKKLISKLNEMGYDLMLLGNNQSSIRRKRDGINIKRKSMEE